MQSRQRAATEGRTRQAMGYKIRRGKVERATKLHPEAARPMAAQRKAFIAKFGREPGPWRSSVLRP
jgi:hypothetical protein